MDNRKEERQGLVDAVSFVPMIQSFRNVDVVGKADWMTYLGSSNVVITPCNYAIILKLDSGWSWFITLSACDYPLIRHDDLSHLFSTVNRDLNFIDQTNDLVWKDDIFHPIVVNPRTYLARISKKIQAIENRKTPYAFKLVSSKSPFLVQQI
ncbi:unnamed protein product [Lathyrus oleraceus]